MSLVLSCLLLLLLLQFLHLFDVFVQMTTGDQHGQRWKSNNEFRAELSLNLSE